MAFMPFFLSSPTLSACVCSSPGERGRAEQDQKRASGMPGATVSGRAGESVLPPLATGGAEAPSSAARRCSRSGAASSQAAGASEQAGRSTLPPLAGGAEAPVSATTVATNRAESRGGRRRGARRRGAGLQGRTWHNRRLSPPGREGATGTARRPAAAAAARTRRGLARHGRRHSRPPRRAPAAR